jgi:hypothetical protein
MVEIRLVNFEELNTEDDMKLDTNVSCLEYASPKG